MHEGVINLLSPDLNPCAANGNLTKFIVPMRYSDHNAFDIFTDFNISLDYLRPKIGTIEINKNKTLLGTIFALGKKIISKIQSSAMKCSPVSEQVN